MEDADGCAEGGGVRVNGHDLVEAWNQLLHVGVQWRHPGKWDGHTHGISFLDL